MGGGQSTSNTAKILNEAYREVLQKNAAKCAGTVTAENLAKFKTEGTFRLQNSKITQQNVAKFAADCMIEQMSSADFANDFQQQVEQLAKQKDASFASFLSKQNIDTVSEIQTMMKTTFDSEKTAECVNNIVTSNVLDVDAKQGVEILGSTIEQKNVIDAVVNCTLAQVDNVKELWKLEKKVYGEAKTDSRSVMGDLAGEAAGALKAVASEVGGVANNLVTTTGKVAGEAIETVGSAFNAIVIGATVGGIVLLIILGVGIYFAMKNPDKVKKVASVATPQGRTLATVSAITSKEK